MEAKDLDLDEPWSSSHRFYCFGLVSIVFFKLELLMAGCGKPFLVVRARAEEQGDPGGFMLGS